jgi:hypothetical protein
MKVYESITDNIASHTTAFNIASHTTAFDKSLSVVCRRSSHLAHFLFCYVLSICFSSLSPSAHDACALAILVIFMVSFIGKMFFSWPTTPSIRWLVGVEGV